MTIRSAVMLTAAMLTAAILAGGLTACGAQTRAGLNDIQEEAVQSTDQPLAELPDGTRWRLADSSRAALQVPEAERVILAFEHGRMQGDSGCNQYVAGYSINDGRIEMQPIGATKRGCMGPIGEVERAWFDALHDLQWISRDGDALVLRLADGDTVRFVPAPLEVR